jgi:RNA polymerase sigma-70 factor (ECF subfamily)
MSSPSDSAVSISSNLLRGLRDDSPEAWQRLIDLWRPILIRWCLRRGLPQQDVEDVVQDVFQAAAKTITSFRRDRSSGSFSAWLATIVRTKVCDYFERQARSPDAVGGSDFQQRLAELSASDESSDRRPTVELRILLLRRVLDLVRQEIAASTWQAFWRSVVEQHDTADIARDLKISAATVRQHKKRVLDRLRAALAEIDEQQA